MRTFTQGTGTDRKFVVIELNGKCVSVTEGKADGTSRRREKELESEAAAKAAGERFATELFNKGFTEQRGAGAAKTAAAAKPAATTKAPTSAKKPVSAKPASRGITGSNVDPNNLFDGLDEGAVASSEPVLARGAVAAARPAPAAEAAPKKKKKKGGKKKKGKQAASGGGAGDPLDKRVLALAGLIAAGLVCGVMFFIYDSFMKPPSIVGTWQGSLLEHEISKSLTHTKYRLVLDDQNKAVLTMQDEFTTAGTYKVNGHDLALNLKDEDGNDASREYTFVLGRSTLDLFKGDKKAVQLVRMHEEPKIGGGKKKGAAAKEVAVENVGEGDKSADAKYASVDFAPKDGAFRVKYPPGWKPESGARSDNSYSWARFTKDSYKIQINADVAGSLMSGSDSARGQDFEEGSEFAPVHRAHEAGLRIAKEDYSDYSESKPSAFKGSGLGEGRLSAFTCSAGGLFGGKLKGYRVTLLTNNRRVTVMCTAPSADFEKIKPTFLAVCHSLAP